MISDLRERNKTANPDGGTLPLKVNCAKTWCTSVQDNTVQDTSEANSSNAQMEKKKNHYILAEKILFISINRS